MLGSSFSHPSRPVLNTSKAQSLHMLPHQSYIIESQGKTYHHNCQHIHPLYSITTPIIRPYSFQDPEPQHSSQTTAEEPVTAISGPCSFQDPVPESNSHTVATIPRPSPSTTE